MLSACRACSLDRPAASPSQPELVTLERTSFFRPGWGLAFSITWTCFLLFDLRIIIIYHRKRWIEKVFTFLFFFYFGENIFFYLYLPKALNRILGLEYSGTFVETWLRSQLRYAFLVQIQIYRYYLCYFLFYMILYV